MEQKSSKRAGLDKRAGWIFGFFALNTKRDCRVKTGSFIRNDKPNEPNKQKLPENEPSFSQTFFFPDLA